MPSCTKDLTAEESSTLLRAGKESWMKLKHRERKNIVSIKKLIAIIQLALMINGDNIYLSDIIR